MFNVDKGHCLSVEQQLLFNIQELLKEVLFCFKEEEENKVQEIPKVIKNEFLNKCKACGGTHSNRGEFLACCRKHKKESG